MALGMRIVIALFAWTASEASRVTTAKESGGNQCADPMVQDVCICDRKSNHGYQCSGCKDGNHWGHGCQLTCPAHCTGKCDFLGNCIADNKCPKNCKRNSRVETPTAKSDCLNNAGFCQACEKGYYGLMCTEKCPSKCKASSAEGMCGRKGTCYQCESGFYGLYCDKKCPAACPKCLQKDGMDSMGNQMPAGSCAQGCEGDLWGTDCKSPCPKDCARTGLKPKQASCSRDAGICAKCPAKRWGDTCENDCTSTCVDGLCDQSEGKCEKGCMPGYFGPTCSSTCPDFTVAGKGCHRETGMPHACDATHFPGVPNEKDGGSACLDCPVRCIDKECGDDQVCTKGCEEGFFGASCTYACPANCDGGCDRATGKCAACVPGHTGEFCKDQCHSRCKTCTQFHKNVPPSAGIKAKDCTSCPEDEPSQLFGPSPSQTCDCIKHADRNAATDKCMCEEPDDVFMEAFFDKESSRCTTKCKEEYNGQELRSVYGEGVHKCIFVNVYNSVVVASHLSGGNLPNKGQGCDPDEYPIDVYGQIHCVREDFVNYITGKKGKKEFAQGA